MLEEKNKIYKATININTRSNVLKYHDKKREVNKLFCQKKREMFKKLETLRSAYNNNKAKWFYQEVNCIKKRL